MQNTSQTPAQLPQISPIPEKSSEFAAHESIAVTKKKCQPGNPVAMKTLPKTSNFHQAKLQGEHYLNSVKFIKNQCRKSLHKVTARDLHTCPTDLNHSD
jgi:hypothetical protein